jgi:hypothetical protein
VATIPKDVPQGEHAGAVEQSRPQGSQHTLTDDEFPNLPAK